MNYAGLPLADIPHLQKYAEFLKTYVEETGDLEGARKRFFSGILVGFYDAMWSGIKEEVGHILYRLCEFVSLEERQMMMIYPSDDGSIIDIHDTLSGEPVFWDSLEDWRHQWEEYHPVIPEFDFQKKFEARKMFQVSE